MLHKQEIIIIMFQFGGFRIFNNLEITEMLHFDFLTQTVLKHSKKVHTNQNCS